MLRGFKLIVLGIALVGLFACSDRPEMADRVLLNGKIVTVDDQQPEAQALAIKGALV